MPEEPGAGRGQARDADASRSVRGVSPDSRLGYATSQAGGVVGRQRNGVASSPGHRTPSVARSAGLLVIRQRQRHPAQPVAVLNEHQHRLAAHLAVAVDTVLHVLRGATVSCCTSTTTSPALMPRPARRAVIRDVSDDDALLVGRERVFGAQDRPSSMRTSSCRAGDRDRRVRAGFGERARSSVALACCTSSGSSAIEACTVVSLPSRHSTTGTFLADGGLCDDAGQGVHVLHVRC